MKWYLILCFWTIALTDSYAFSDTTRFDRTGLYLGIEASSIFAPRPGFQLQGTYYVNPSNGFSINGGWIENINGNRTGSEYKVKYNRHIVESLYVTAGGIKSNSTLSGTMIFLVDNSFYQEVDIQQTYELKGGLFGLGLFLPLPGLGALDMNFSLLYGREQRRNINAIPNNARVVNDGDLPADVRLENFIEDATITSPAFDISILAKF